MLDASNELKGKIMTGKQALSNNYIDLAIQAFQEALKTKIPENQTRNSLIGIAQAYLLLAMGIKGIHEDQNIATQISQALELFPSEKSQITVYLSLLMDVGKGLQKISFFESSSIVYKKALQYAKTLGAQGDIKTISTISWNLAFSYQNLERTEAAAKLYRIAADLEPNPKDAITLYYSSAYQYYQLGMKEEALDISQTAFDKAGILKQTDLQNEIAEFQGIISFEIYKAKEPNELSDSDCKYLEIAKEKFVFINHQDWLNKIENERSLLSSRIKKVKDTKPIYEKLKSKPLSQGIKTIGSDAINTSSSLSRNAREIIDESTQTLNNLSKLSSEGIQPEEAIEELYLADKALSEDKSLMEKFKSPRSYDRLFSRHKTIAIDESSVTDDQSANLEPSANSQKPRVIGVPILAEVSSKLQKAGWLIQTNEISSNKKNPEPDIIAEKGLVRKKRKMIFFAEDELDAEICSFLLQNNIETGDKYVFLLSGDPKKAKISKKVRLVTRMDQIFDNDN